MDIHHKITGLRIKLFNYLFPFVSKTISFLSIAMFSTPPSLNLQTKVL